MESTKLEVNSLESLNKYLEDRNTSQNSFYLSNIPEICKESPCLLGIDEAGRGPVLGPMVYGTSFCPIDKAEHLKILECADSKVLNEEKRDQIFTNICKSSEIMGWAVDVISPNQICNGMLSRTKHSLNAISMDSAVGLINAVIKAGVNLTHIYVDTVGKPEKYQEYLLSLFPSYDITVSKKADSIYPIVSAASICAKVTRDHALQVWKFPEGMTTPHTEFGSGYPGDPVTKKYLAQKSDPVFGYPQLVRFSWSTAAKALDDHSFEVEWEDLEDEQATPAGNTSITSFFNMVKKDGIKRKKKSHDFFIQRNLSSKVEF